MGTSVYKDCVNCGKQNILDEIYKPGDKCEFGNHPVGVKIQKGQEEAYMETKDGGASEETPRDTSTAPDPSANPKAIPPKPDTTGLSVYKKNIALHDYYLANKDEIFTDIDVLGMPKAMVRWGISYSTVRLLQGKKIGRVKKEKAPKTPKIPKSAASTTPDNIHGKESLSLTRLQEVEAEYRGYRLAVQDIFGGKDYERQIMAARKASV